MKLSVALFFAGFFGALGAVLFFVSFGTDYWLLATETCSPENNGSNTVNAVPLERSDMVTSPKKTDSTYHHEGFFWRCWFGGKLAEDNIWKFWFTNQPPSKLCMHSYLFPFPVTTPAHNSTSYDTAVSVFFSAVVVMYVIWVQVLSTMTDYKQQQKTSLCPDFQINIRYGWSFMLAPVGIFFSFLVWLCGFVKGYLFFSN
ncbi:UNVERIFIED_CONTAM: hypothetical protein FKN15_017790 [Acipenser sinensis]